MCSGRRRKLVLNPIQIILGAPVSNAASIEGLLAHPEVMMGCNIYSVVFDWRQNRLRLASGEVPAAVGGYREYPLRLRKTCAKAGLERIKFQI
jgi:hypothetical protein